MPDNYFNTQNPWLVGAGFGNSLANTLQGVALRVPQARAQGALMGAQMQAEQARVPLYQAQAQSEQAQARHYDAGTAETQQRVESLKLQQEGLGNIYKAIASGQQMNPEDFRKFGAGLSKASDADVMRMGQSMFQALQYSNGTPEMQGALAGVNPQELGVRVGQNDVVQMPGGNRIYGPSVTGSGAEYNPSPTGASTNTNFRPPGPANQNEAQVFTQVYRSIAASDDGMAAAPEEIAAQTRKIVDAYFLGKGGVTNPPISLPGTNNVIQLPGGVTITREK